MDYLSFLLSMGILRNLPGTAASQAQEAAQSASADADRAEAAAETAASRNYGVSVSGNTLTFTANT